MTTSPTDVAAFDSLVCEILQRIDAGEDVDRMETIAQHPDFADRLAAFFDGEDLVARMAGPVVRTDNLAAAETAAHVPAANLSTAETRTSAEFDSQTNRRPGEQAVVVESFGRYRIQRTLGEGAMGSVHLAEDTMLQREVALKLPKFGDDDPEMLERFLVEARAAANLRHPNICPVHDVGEVDGRYFITMAFIPGRPLSDYAKTARKQKLRQVVKVVRKLALALHAAHEAGVVHRDVKPANVMIDENGEPIVMDFGLARQTTNEEVRLTKSGAIMGTPAYMSPEQVEGRIDEVGTASDQFSLGAVLYEMMTGELPFPGQSMGLVMSRILNDEPTPASALRPDVDPELEAICQRMLSKPAGDRYDSLADVATALNEWLQGDKDRMSSVGDPSATAPFAHPGASGIDEPDDGTNRVTQIEEPEPRPKRKKRTRRPQSTPTPAPTAPPSSSRPPWLWIAGGLGGASALILGLVFLLRTPYGTLKITVDDPRLTVVVEGDESPTITLTDGKGFDKRRRAGKHRLSVMIGETPLPLDKETIVELDGEDRKVKLDVSGVTLSGNEFMIDRNGESAVTIVLLDTTTSSEDESDARETGGGQPRFALDFDGVDDVVRIPTLVYDGSHPITLEAWVRPESANGEDNFFRFFLSNFDRSSKVPSGLGLQQRLGSDGTGWGFWVSVPCEDGFAKRADSGRWQIGRLSHVSLVVDGLVYRFFVDGKIATMGRLPCEQVTNDRPFAIGNARFDGTIEEVRVSKVARYMDEFEPRRHLAADENTVALYHFDEGDGEILTDSSGNGHHGRIVGAKWVPVVPAAGGDLDTPFTFPPQLTDLATGQWQPIATKPADLVLETNHGATLNNGAVELVAPEGRVDGRVVFEKVRGRRIIVRADVERLVGHTAGLAFEGKRRDYNIHGAKNRNEFTLGYRVQEVKQEDQNFEPPAPATTSGSHDLALAIVDGHAALYLDGKLVLERDDCEDWAWTPMLSNFNWEDKEPARAVYRNLRVMVLDNLVPLPPRPAVAPFDGEEAMRFQKAWGNFLDLPVERDVVVGKGADGDPVTVRMVLVPPGEFTMGSTREERERYLAEARAARQNVAAFKIPFEGPPHRVRITEPFYMAKTECTQAQWMAVMGFNPSQYAGNPARPVEHVSWTDASTMTQKLTTKAASTGLVFDLPTEAQWEYACRAGTTTAWHYGDDVAAHGKFAWYGENSNNEPHDVGQLEPNNFGLHDMLGGITEHCSDWMGRDFYQSSPMLDPVGPPSGTQRTRRGGSYWGGFPGYQRSANRAYGDPNERNRHTGLRLAARIPMAKRLPLDWSTSATKPPPVDLLVLLDVNEHAVKGAWQRTDEGLVTPPEWTSRLRIPYEPPEEYEVDLDVDQPAGDKPGMIGVGLLVGGQQILLAVDAFPVLMPPGRTGLQQIDGKPLLEGEATRTGFVMTPGRSNRIRCRVTHGGKPGEYDVLVTVNGEAVVNWTGEATRLSNDGRFDVGSAKSLFLASGDVGATITRVELHPLSESTGTNPMRNTVLDRSGT